MKNAALLLLLVMYPLRSRQFFIPNFSQQLESEESIEAAAQDEEVNEEAIVVEASDRPDGLLGVLYDIGRHPWLSEENWAVRNLGTILKITFFLYNLGDHFGLGMAVQDLYHQVEENNEIVDEMDLPPGVAFTSTFTTAANETATNGTSTSPPVGITFSSTFFASNGTVRSASDADPSAPSRLRFTSAGKMGRPAYRTPRFDQFLYGLAQSAASTANVAWHQLQKMVH